jgi:Mg-chelatase subunit ChlD
VDGMVFEDGDIRVDKTSGVYGDSPFTLQTGGCGDHGQYIQVTDRMLQLANFDEIFGPPGQVFVHEWAKYRYGVFEEHGYPGDEKYPMFYIKTTWTVNGEESKLVPNFCLNTDVDFTIESMDGGNCHFDELTGLPGSDCVFTPGNTNGIKSSIMALPYVDGNNQFCDESETFFHDTTLPTKHNALCQAQSTFSVILQHEDFKNFISNSSKESNPQFELLLPKASSSYVMVLDVSGSMNDFDRIGRMKNSAIRFVKYDLDENVPLGVVRFSSKADILFGLESLTPQNRQKVLTILEGLSAGGGTCLGAALRAGLTTLKNGGVDHGGVLIFLTDGQQSCDGPDQSDIPDVINDVVKQGVRVIAIAFGSSADSRIIELADKTGGKAFFIPDGTGPEDINNALQSSLTYQPSVPSDQFDIIIAKETFKNFNKVSLPFYIDNTIGNNVVVQIDFTGNTVSTIVIGNYTDTFSEANGVYEKVFDVLESGKYEVNISSSSLIRFSSVTISSKAKNDTLPIFTRCWTSAGSEKADLSAGNKIAVIAQILQGTNPVIRAKVKAYIEKDGADAPMEVELFDQGSDPDSIKDDGIYSRYFTSFVPSAAEVRYTLKCQVESTDDSSINQGFLDARNLYHSSSHARSLPKRPSPDSPICCGSSTVTEDSVLVPTGQFGRTETGTMLSIVNSDKANFPPGSVSNLVAGGLDLGTGTFSIMFTAPGSVLDSGTADAYKIYFSIDQSVLTNASALENCDYINETFLAPGSANMTPVEAGTFVKLTVLTEHFTNFQMKSPKFKATPLPRASFQYFFLLEASAGKLKSTSNIARLYMDRYSGDNHWNGQTNVAVDFYLMATLLTLSVAVTAGFFRD